MDLKVDSDNDVIIGTDGDLVMVEGQEAIEQHLKARLLTFYTEWFLDQDVGVPYIQQVLAKNPDPVVLDSIFIKEIINTPGITELIDFALDLSTSRELTLEFKAKTIDGIINFSEVLPII